jgi:hypothetical protein
MAPDTASFLVRVPPVPAIEIRFHLDNVFESCGLVTLEGNFVKIGIELDGKERT